MIISLFLVVIISITVIVAYLPYESSLNIPNNIPLEVRMKDNYESKDRILMPKSTEKLVKLINKKKYVKAIYAPSNYDGRVINFIIDIDISKMPSGIDNRNQNFPVMVILFEKALDRSYIIFNDIKKKELINFKLEKDQILQLYEFYQKLSTIKQDIYN